MKKTTEKPACMEKMERNEKRLAKMRENLEKLENKADSILAKKELTIFDRFELLSLLNIAYHDSGKIEEIASIDGTSACAFCDQMRKMEDNDIKGGN